MRTFKIETKDNWSLTKKWMTVATGVELDRGWVVMQNTLYATGEPPKIWRSVEEMKNYFATQVPVYSVTWSEEEPEKMKEPSNIGAVVGIDDPDKMLGAVQVMRGGWWSGGQIWSWDQLMSPRPLTDEEKVLYDIPETLPDGWVAVDAGDIDREHLGSWMSDHWPDDLHIGLVQDVARAETERRGRSKK